MSGSLGGLKVDGLVGKHFVRIGSGHPCLLIERERISSTLRHITSRTEKTPRELRVGIAALTDVPTSD